jgi:hypothetical protein
MSKHTDNTVNLKVLETPASGLSDLLAKIEALDGIAQHNLVEVEWVSSIADDARRLLPSKSGTARQVKVRGV